MPREHCKEERIIYFVKSDGKVQNWPYTVLRINCTKFVNQHFSCCYGYSANKTETIMLHTGHPFQQLSVTLHHLWVVDLRRIGSNSVSREPALTLCVYKSHNLYYVQDSPLCCWKSKLCIHCCWYHILYPKQETDIMHPLLYARPTMVPPACTVCIDVLFK